jgi:hypothetical protein
MRKACRNIYYVQYCLKNKTTKEASILFVYHKIPFYFIMMMEKISSGRTIILTTKMRSDQNASALIHISDENTLHRAVVVMKMSTHSGVLQLFHCLKSGSVSFWGGVI